MKSLGVGEVNSCKEKDTTNALEVEFAEVNVDVKEIGGTRGVGLVGVGVDAKPLRWHNAAAVPQRNGPGSLVWAQLHDGGCHSPHRGHIILWSCRYRFSGSTRSLAHGSKRQSMDPRCQ